jgi:plastocyanin
VLLLAGLSTGHKIGLAIVAALFIGFALASSFLAPRRWPDFPGRHALSVFVIACFVLFFGMLAAVFFFGRESEASAKAAEATAGSPAKRTIQVSEREFRIQLPPLKELSEGTYTFVVHNVGTIAHNLVVQGPNAAGPQTTPLIQPGQTAKLTVSLAVGRYTLFCSVDDHRRLGMVAQLSVG